MRFLHPRSFGRLLNVSVFVAVLGAASAPAAFAQIEAGRLTGTVTDAQGGALPGVTVTATSPSLIGKEAQLTEADGKYRFPSLSSGSYTLTFELLGFRTFKREGIVLTLGNTLTVDAQLQVASLQESVTVTGESPVVDLQTTKVGSAFSAETLSNVPTATDVWAALGQAPGVRMLGFDVGGSHKSQQTAYESFGIRNQNRVLSDGVDTTEGTGAAGFYADFFVNEEIAVTAAGTDVEMYGPGSAVVSTIKSGGNAFKMLNNITYEGQRWVGNNVDGDTSARGFTGQPNLIFWEGHSDLGGPVKHDRAWFFAAYNHFKIDKVISGVPRTVATDLGLFDNVTVKGTGKLSQRDTVIGYYQYGRKQKPYRGLSTTVLPEATLAQDSVSWVYKGEHQRVWSNRFFTDVRVGVFGYTWPMAPKVDYKTNPPRIDTGTSVETGAGWNAGTANGGPQNADRNKPQIYAVGKYFLPGKAGSHDLKFGAEWLDDQSKFANNGQSGPIWYRDRNGQVDEIRLADLGDPTGFQTAWLGNNDVNTRMALFVQDGWNAGRVTFTLGLRYDRQQPNYKEGHRVAVLKDIFPESTIPAAVLLTSNRVSPRLGVSYDVTGQGNTVLKAFYGRYYFNFADRLDILNPGGTNRRDYKFLDQNGNRLYDGPQELGTLVSSAGGVSTRLDPNLKTPYADEFSLSLERQFWGESSGRVAYVRKMVRDDFTTINLAREGQFTVATPVTIGIRSFDSPTIVNQSLTVYDIPTALRGVTDNVVMNIPNFSNNYDTIQFAFNKRFRRGLFIQSSFDYQWRDEIRTTSPAPSTSPLNSDPIAVGYFQNVFPAVPNQQKNTNWQGRLLGRYVFTYDVGFAANIRAQSGWQYARLLQVSLPIAGTQTFFMEPLQNNRSDNAVLLDLRLDKSMRLGRYKLTFMADLFNALNSNAVSNFQLVNGTNYNKIVATLDPRTAQVGFRFEF